MGSMMKVPGKNVRKMAVFRLAPSLTQRRQKISPSFGFVFGPRPVSCSRLVLPTVEPPIRTQRNNHLLLDPTILTLKERVRVSCRVFVNLQDENILFISSQHSQWLKRHVNSGYVAIIRLQRMPLSDLWQKLSSRLITRGGDGSWNKGESTLSTLTWTPGTLQPFLSHHYFVYK